MVGLAIFGSTCFVLCSKTGKGLSLRCSKEFMRYAVVGAVTNMIAFLLYVFITFLGVSPVLTISIVYPVHIGAAYYFNKKWSFNYHGRLSSSAIRYLVSYIGCYALNVVVLEFFSGYLGFSHLIVQAVAVVMIALVLFLAQKFWVFKVLGGSALHGQEL